MGQVHADASSGLSAGTSSGLVLVFDIPPKGTNITVSEVLEQHHDAITDIAAELGQAPVCVHCRQPLGPEEPVGSLALGQGVDGDSSGPLSPTAVLEMPRRCQLWELRFTQALAMAELIPGCSPSPQEPVLSMASPIPAAGKLWGACDVAELPQSWLLSAAQESGWLCHPSLHQGHWLFWLSLQEEGLPCQGRICLGEEVAWDCHFPQPLLQRACEPSCHGLVWHLEARQGKLESNVV